MCGIVALVDFEVSPTETEIIKMRDVIQYRGPDNQGLSLLKKEGIALGHRRLSILDTRTAGKQPMSNSRGDLTVVFNGEIYNYIEIRNELLEKGYSFKTATDTEVLINAYDCWGKQCLQYFVGMFAFAIWDNRKKELFVARDRIGIKPFYYYQLGSRFYLSSEVKSILAVLSDFPPVDKVLIDTYLSFGYVPGENTMNTGIKKLLPGHSAILNKSGFFIEKYWDLHFDQNTDKGLDYYVEHLNDLIGDAIDLRLRSDVPLGIFLSGGIDSSAVVALLSARAPQKLKTFSVAYEFGAQFNETAYARVVADHFDTEHHELIVTPEKFSDFIPGYIRHMDEPVTESAAISLYYLSQMAKNHVTVVLSGEGADELFAGYDFYVYNLVIEKYRRMMGNELSPLISNMLASLLPLKKLQKYLELSQHPLEKRYKGISSYQESLKNELYLDEYKAFLGRQNNPAKEFIQAIFNTLPEADPLSKMLYFDTKTWLVDDLLIKADRMSMAASLELRVPFLDHRVVEFAATIPSKYKIKGRTTKYLFKEMMRGKLPDQIIDRKKMGFPTPLAIMFKTKLFSYAHDTLLSKASIGRGYFQEKTIRNILNEHQKGEADHHRVIWLLLVLEEWHRQFA